MTQFFLHFVSHAVSHVVSFVDVIVIMALSTSTSTSTQPLYVKKNGVVIKTKITQLPTEALPGLVAVDTVVGTVMVDDKDKKDESDNMKTDNDCDTHESSTLNPSNTPSKTVAQLYVQKPKHDYQRQLIQNDTRLQIAEWMKPLSRAPFVQRLLMDAFVSTYNKSLHVVLVDAQKEPPKVRLVLLKKDYQKLEGVVGRNMMQQLCHLPDKLIDMWFPLIIIHPMKIDSLQTNQTPLSSVSYTIIPYPEPKNWTSWAPSAVHRFVINFLTMGKPISIVSWSDRHSKKKKKSTKHG
jgi:hypothetical protein